MPKAAAAGPLFESNTMNQIEKLQEALRQFAAERDWQQFHSPKNLAMALMAEAAEVGEHFLWLDGPQSAALSAASQEEVALELADVFLYLLRLADQLQIDLVTAAERKLAINAERYPVALARGRADKYDKLQNLAPPADDAPR
jgi:NTP pyrophosphatase (non-canonical NTP hydrolase)